MSPLNVMQDSSHLGVILAANNDDDGYEGGHKKHKHNGGPGMKNCYDY